MPPLHRYLGNPVLSFIGRLFFRSKIGDFHCGLRGFNRDSVMALNLQATGMEFASELVVKAALYGQHVTEVPTTLAKDGRSRPPHLHTWRDGWRHLRFLLLFSPRWLFFLPGLVLLVAGLIVGAIVIPHPFKRGSITFDVDTLVAASAAVVIGFQSVLFSLFTQVYAGSEGFLPKEPQDHPPAGEAQPGTRADPRRADRPRGPGGTDLLGAVLARPELPQPQLRALAAADDPVGDRADRELPGDPGHVLPVDPGHQAHASPGDRLGTVRP